MTFSASFLPTIILLSCISCSSQTGEQNSNSNLPPSNEQTSAASTQQENLSERESSITSKWKKYTDRKNGYSFLYPPYLTMIKKDNKVRLLHSINFRHQDPCDNSGNPPFKQKLVDFDLTFEVSDKNFESKEWDTTGTEVPFELPKLSKSILGKSNWYSYDGCGKYEFIYPFGEKRSLVIHQPIVGLFSAQYSSSADAQKAMKHPNLIRNDSEIRDAIIKSFSRLK